MRPLTELRAKPALPVRGRPVISLLLAFLARHGIRDVMINLHHLPETIRRAVALDHPEELEILWSDEPMPLGTGGGIRRAADFLREDPECLVIAGDMLLDFDLESIVSRHRAAGRAATLLLRKDSRDVDFGTVGVDASGQVIRIGRRLQDRLRGEEPTEAEHAAGLFTGVRIFSREILDHWPEAEVFEDLRDWLVPAIVDRGAQVGAEIVCPANSVWEPVGTPAEYLRVNLAPPDLPSLGGPARAWEGDVRPLGEQEDVLLGRDVSVGSGLRLEQAVVWDEERIPDGFQGRSGVFAGGRFHVCPDSKAGSSA
jgi:NDP-sugar pyrophosphorylase family protein